MAASALQYLGLLLGGLGAAGTVAVTIMPQWRVAAFIGGNLVVFEDMWEGLWMNCRVHLNLRLQCKVYDSVLALPPDLQAARGLMSAASALAGLALLAAVLGTGRVRCAGDGAKGPLLLAAGVLFVVAGVAVLAPVSWVAHSIIRDFYNPMLHDGTRRELGSALYLGWAVALGMLAAGASLVCAAQAHGQGPPYGGSGPARRGPETWASVHSETKYM